MPRRPLALASAGSASAWPLALPISSRASGAIDPRLGAGIGGMLPSSSMPLSHAATHAITAIARAIRITASKSLFAKGGGIRFGLIAILDMRSLYRGSLGQIRSACLRLVLTTFQTATYEALYREPPRPAKEYQRRWTRNGNLGEFLNVEIGRTSTIDNAGPGGARLNSRHAGSDT